MSAKQESPTRILEGVAGRYEIAPKEWAEMLVFLEDRGWHPEQRRMNYVATGTQVSDIDAGNLAEAGQRVLDTALTDPLSVYPVPFDMGKLWELNEFCRAGGFRICR